MNNAFEVDEVQGLILNGYGDRPAAKYAMFEVEEMAVARRWLGRILPLLQFGDYRRTPKGQPPHLNPLCVNIAFTHAGLGAMGLHDLALAGFSLPFQEGPAEPNRARRLGDDGESAPENWVWGYPGHPVHGMLAVFAGHRTATPEDWTSIDRFLETQLSPSNGVRILSCLDTTASDRMLLKEHFGFRDGVSRPQIRSLSRPGSSESVADGEVLLGYKNGYGRLPMSPEVPAGNAGSARLPPSVERPERRDFGRNGSYLVFRQLRQDVQGFWRFIEAAAKGASMDLPAGVGELEALAARFVGRWLNGTPLTKFSQHPGPDKEARDNDFLYGSSGDAYGDKCPIGAHIRRANPRDTALPVPHDPELSGTPVDPKVARDRVRLTKLHQVLRRGRAYGSPLDPAFDPKAVLASGFEPNGERGLHFLCFNANLSRQFEFIQAHWVVNPAFAGLSADPDPLLSIGRQFPFPANNFTIQGCPARRLSNVGRFVELRGSAYFFMPSRSALDYLSGE